MDDDASEKRRTLQRVCSRSTRCPHSRSAPSSKCQHAFARESCLHFSSAQVPPAAAGEEAPHPSPPLLRGHRGGGVVRCRGGGYACVHQGSCGSRDRARRGRQGPGGPGTAKEGVNWWRKNFREFSHICQGVLSNLHSVFHVVSNFCKPSQNSDNVSPTLSTHMAKSLVET